MASLRTIASILLSPLTLVHSGSLRSLWRTQILFGHQVFLQVVLEAAHDIGLYGSGYVYILVCHDASPIATQSALRLPISHFMLLLILTFACSPVSVCTCSRMAAAARIRTFSLRAARSKRHSVLLLQFRFPDWLTNFAAVRCVFLQVLSGALLLKQAPSMATFEQQQFVEM